MTDFSERMEEFFRQKPSPVEQHIRAIAREIVLAAQEAGANLSSLEIQIVVGAAIERAIAVAERQNRN